jgi:hypothetical protein
MAEIHDTTLSPGKLELLADWLPTRPWYSPRPGGPQLERAGGFRLDDPAGAVGIEFMFIADGADAETGVATGAIYHVPLTYRDAPLPGAEAHLIGTSEHGVLGTRWVYDGIRDPVLIAQLLACIRGDAPPQMQRVSFTPDPTVEARFDGAGRLAADSSPAIAEGPGRSDIPIGIAVLAGTVHKPATLRIHRVLEAGGDAPTAPTGLAGAAGPDAGATIGDVTATWLRPAGEAHRGPVAVIIAS